MQSTVAVIAIVVVGMMVGVEFAVAVFVNPMLDRLPEAHGLAGRSDGARVLGKVMPIWYFASLALTSVSAGLGWGDPRTWCAIAAAALLVVSILMSLALLVPIASRTARWTAEDAPDNWREQVNRWAYLHFFRVGIITASFALLAASAV
jgi:uncharacterized membrane protein